jgi:hypothetical protein
MNEQKFRAVVEAAVRECDEYLGKDLLGAWNAMVDKITSAADDWASERYQDGRTQGMGDERKVHFG